MENEMEKLRKLQMIEVELLDEVVRICNENNITYYLYAGTLLGAVRHKGFIPWDDDIDVIMFRQDFEKFSEIADKCLNKEKYFLHDYRDSHYHSPVLRIRKNGTVYSNEKWLKLGLEHYGCWIDIFRLDNVKSPKSLQYHFQVAAKQIGRLCFHRALTNVDGMSFPHKLLFYFSRILPLKTWIKIRDNIYKMNHDNNSEYITNFCTPSRADIQVMPREKYLPPVLVEFEGKKYSAPRDWDYVLRHLYGDYMQMPPIEKRNIQHEPYIWEL